MEAPISIPPNWQLEFHVHTNASLLAVGAMLAQTQLVSMNAYSICPNCSKKHNIFILP
jgi:hypothetical protein